MSADNPFRIGDIVAVTSNAPEQISPVRLVKQYGYPNRFHVMHVKPAILPGFPYGTISLKECCFSNSKTNINCFQHCAEYFELLSRRE